MRKQPACAGCGLEIMPCAPCCRHSGWVHRHDGSHRGPDGHAAFPFRLPAGSGPGSS